MNKKCLWCVHDIVLTDNDGKRLHVCTNRRSGKFLQELDILEDGCGGFEEERFLSVLTTFLKRSLLQLRSLLCHV